MRALRRFLYDLLATEASLVFIFLLLITAIGVMIRLLLAL